MCGTRDRVGAALEARGFGVAGDTEDISLDLVAIAEVLKYNCFVLFIIMWIVRVISRFKVTYF